MLPADESVQVGADAIGSAHHSHGVRSRHRLLSRRPWPPSIQRCPYSLSLSLSLSHGFVQFCVVIFGLDEP